MAELTAELDAAELSEDEAVRVEEVERVVPVVEVVAVPVPTMGKSRL